jgi:two-component system, NtrC family, sensor kinase
MLFTNEKMVKPNFTISHNQSDEPFQELKFITELGRSMLSIFHPKRVAMHVSEAIQGVVNADVCLVIVKLDEIGLVSSAIDLIKEEDLLDKRHFQNWLEFFPPKISFWNQDKHFISGNHLVEYVSPLLIEGKVKGAIIVGFDNRLECGESEQKLIDAATQLTAVSINLSANHESVLNTSVHLAREEQRKFTEAILDALPVSLYVIDRDYHIVAWNRHREIGTLGLPREEVLGRDVFEILTKQPRGKLHAEFEKAFISGEIERIEQRTTDDNGATKHWLVSKVPMRDAVTKEVTHVITVGEDITVRVEAIHAVGRAEKLAAVGRLAAGVVHEINNPLATISACAEALESRVAEGVFGNSPDVEDLREYLGLIRSEAFRCKSITNGLLDFSRVRTGNRFPINISEVIKSSARLLSHQKRGENIEIIIDIEENLPLVNADEGQMQQAIIALSTNAIDAMPKGGNLTLKVFSQNRGVIVEIIDTGIGIKPDDMSKIFEPFFTTKEVGQGTGLGLAVCYGIITEHGGRLSVRSKLGTGTTFTMFLPIHK